MVPHARSGAAPCGVGSGAGESPDAGVAIRTMAAVFGMAPPLPVREVVARVVHVEPEVAAMLKRVLFTSVFMLAAAVAVSATVVGAGALTDRVEARRMTVLKTDVGTGRFLCVEHLHWTPVAKADLSGLQPGDIVRVEPRASGRPRLILLRTAAEEISSPEN
jgi:hypothetical protein